MNLCSSPIFLPNFQDYYLIITFRLHMHSCRTDYFIPPFPYFGTLLRVRTMNALLHLVALLFAYLIVYNQVHLKTYLTEIDS